MIAKLFIGWRILIDGNTYVVVGNRNLRGRYRYLIRNEQGQIASLLREDMLAWQSSGRLQVIG